MKKKTLKRVYKKLKTSIKRLLDHFGPLEKTINKTISYMAVWTTFN